MATPTTKSTILNSYLEETFGRTTIITTNQCAGIMMGMDCETPNFEWTDQVSQKEYSISGMCQNCQDKSFGDDSTW